MEISLFLFAMLGCVLIAATVRMGLHEAFHDQSARFAALECAMHDSARVNAKRKVRGQTAYTTVHGSDGSNWPLREVED